jgi:putative ABC transport system permease protein
MDRLLQDLRYAFRTLRKSPGFAAVAVLTLALGIGINTTIFSVVNAILVRPMPGVRTEGLVALRETQPARGFDEDAVSAPNLLDWKAGSRTLAGVGAYWDRKVVFRAPAGEPEEVEAEMVTAGLFPMLSARPALGRLFTAADAAPGAERVVLLTDGFWRRRLAADPAIVGKTLNLDGVPRTVVGVMPPHFGFPDNQPLWMPFSLDDPAYAGRGEHFMRALGRLRPGTGIAAAQAELSAAAARLGRRFPETNSGRGVAVVDFQEAWVGRVRPVLLMMLAAVGFVLLIACSNVANLYLARGSSRRRELAVRTALGAGRGRLVRQLLTEGAVVALAGGALGVLLAHQALALILASFPFEPPIWMVFDVDRNVLLFTLGVSLATAMVFGLAPALHVTRPEPMGTLRGGRSGETPRQRRLARTLVVAQLALSVVLLTAATLMARSVVELQSTDPGFQTSHLLSLRVSGAGPRYAQPADRAALAGRLLDRMAALPGVERTALVSAVPLGSGGSTSGYDVEGHPVPPGERPSADVRGISSAYWDALGRPLLRGRGFTAAEDASGAPLAVVSRTLAERAWPGQDAVGRRINPGGEWLTVVGVAPDVRLNRLDEGARAQVYLPFGREPRRAFTYLLRTGAAPASVAAAARAAVHGVDPGLPIADLLPMDDVVRQSLWQQKLFGGLFASFAAIALLLAVTGVYGVISYSVTQRMHEFGVRMALGAGAGAVRRLVLRGGAGMAAAGVGIGLAGAFALTRVMGSLLYGVSPSDPLSFGAVAFVLGGACLAACLVPALRATRVDPNVALRAD